MRKAVVDWTAEHAKRLRPVARLLWHQDANPGTAEGLAATFRRRVEDEHLACWNLSDYALPCWRSVGGDTADLTWLWQQTDRELTYSQRLAVKVRKEKAGVTLPGQAADFAAAARRVAASTPGRG